MTTINLNYEQLEVAEMAITTLIEQLATDQRESTYSKIIENRLKIALEIKKILEEERPTI